MKGLKELLRCRRVDDGLVLRKAKDGFSNKSLNVTQYFISLESKRNLGLKSCSCSKSNVMYQSTSHAVFKRSTQIPTPSPTLTTTRPHQLASVALAKQEPPRHSPTHKSRNPIRRVHPVPHTNTHSDTHTRDFSWSRSSDDLSPAAVFRATAASHQPSASSRSSANCNFRPREAPVTHIFAETSEPRRGRN